jgi:hypothetical protein
MTRYPEVDALELRRGGLARALFVQVAALRTLFREGLGPLVHGRSSMSSCA